MFRKSLISMGFLISVAAAGVLAGGDKTIPNVSGSFGGFASLRGEVVTALLPYIEQDNLRKLTGQVELQLETPITVDVSGKIQADGDCQLKSTDSAESLRFASSWQKVGGGAGILIGIVTIGTGKEATTGSMVFLRPFTPTGEPTPSIKGDYSGGYTSDAGDLGEVVASISDGTSNTRTLNFTMRSGRVSQQFSAAADVNSNGDFVAVGLDADGNIVAVTGSVSTGRTGQQLDLSYSIFDPSGIAIESGSIIAILIG